MNHNTRPKLAILSNIPNKSFFLLTKRLIQSGQEVTLYNDVIFNAFILKLNKYFQQVNFSPHVRLISNINELLYSCSQSAYIISQICVFII